MGIVTKTNFVNKLITEGQDPKTADVHSVMRRPLLSLDQFIQRSEANEFMLRKKIKHLGRIQEKKSWEF